MGGTFSVLTYSYSKHETAQVPARGISALPLKALTWYAMFSVLEFLLKGIKPSLKRHTPDLATVEVLELSQWEG